VVISLFIAQTPFMKEFIRPVQVRWSDLDPNVHLRHSVYYDWGAFCRISFLEETGLSADVMRKLMIGPILFREECVFRKEVRLGDDVSINLEVTRARKDFSRWTIQHQIQKNGDTVAAVLTVDGAWLDVVKRKLTTPPSPVVETFSQMPVAEDFKWMD
jgi:acyl-CoA thioester hydrolase